MAHEHLEAENIADVLANGPGLRVGRNMWVEARDPAGHVLLGGLGAMGVGRMWFKDDPRHVDYEGYASAPLRVRRCEAWAPPGSTLAFASCTKEYGHDGAHEVPAVSYPAVSWDG